jgi:hypothetical protein
MRWFTCHSKKERPGQYFNLCPNHTSLNILFTHYFFREQTFCKSAMKILFFFKATYTTNTLHFLTRPGIKMIKYGFTKNYSSLQNNDASTTDVMGTQI